MFRDWPFPRSSTLDSCSQKTKIKSRPHLNLGCLHKSNREQCDEGVAEQQQQAIVVALAVLKELMGIE